MLVTQTPRGLYERFFEEVVKAVDDEAEPLAFEDQTDVERVVEIAARYGIEGPQHRGRAQW